MDNILISSTEELSPEDRLLLASSKRQEPQGEEHASCSITDSKSKVKGQGQDRQSHQDRQDPLLNLNSLNSLNLSGSGLQRTKKVQQVSSDSESDSSDDEDDGIVYQNVAGLGNLLNSNQNNSNSNSLSSRGGLNRNSGTNSCNLSLDSNSHSTYNTLIIHHNNNSLLADTWIPASHEFTSLATGSNRNSTCSNPRKSQSPSRDTNMNMHVQTGSGYDYDSLLQDNSSANNELSDIPRDYLNQLTVLKHLAKEVQQDPISGPPNSKLLRSASFSRSQPDLSQSTPMSVVPPTSSSYYYGPGQQQYQYQYPEYPHYQNQINPPRKKKVEEEISTFSGSNNANPNSNSQREETMPSTSIQMLEILMRENSNLRVELANARMRIQTIHKLESELTRLQKQHASLFESAERRESLERTARAKLSTEVKRLTAVNRELLSSSNSLQNLSSYSSMGSDVDSYRKELSKKDMTIAQIVSQNKELATTKERQEIELTAQRATLEEQRTHIDILDSALTTAQGNVVRLEEECRRNQEYVEKVSQLQRALSSLQLYNEKREQSEKKLRSQLESEITDLKLQLASKNAKSNLNNTRANPHQQQHNQTPNSNSNSNPNNSRNYTAPPPYPGQQSQGQSHQNQSQMLQSNSSSREDIAPELQLLQEKLRLSEDKIQSLTSVVQRWENFFSIDSPSEKTPMTSVSTPNTPNSWSSRGGTPHFFGNGGGGSGSSSTAALDDLPSTQNRATDLEWKIKDLESRLVEKDNMLRALNFQGVPQSQQMPNYSYSSNSSYLPQGYRESPNYNGVSMGSILQHPLNQQKPQINHQVSVSLASMMDSSRRYGIDPMLFYEKVGKCESEPPSYANLPPKLRLGGSGSSLAKNSNESLGSAGLSSGMSNNGMSNNASEPESVSSDERNAKSIDEQLKELNTQLLSKGAAGLKMQSGLCCIPGFANANPSFTARKGKIPQPLLEGLSPLSMSQCQAPHDLSNSTTANLSSSTNPPYKKSVLPPLPRPPNSQVHPSQQSRTSSGPPFISPESGPGVPPGVPYSPSVDSILSNKSGIPSHVNINNPTCGGNVFTPVSNLPKGLPPKSPGIPESSKCRSLERDQKSKSSNNETNSKFTPGGYDPSRCKSLDRRELKAQAKEREKEEKDLKEKEKKLQKSSVGSKAAFFGGLLSRRSPSPSRKAKDSKDKEESKVPVAQLTNIKGRFPFSRTQSHTLNQNLGSQAQDNTSTSDQEIDTEFLDLQGRSSQRSRISKWTSSTSNLESLQENPGLKDSPWVQRRSGGESTSRKASVESIVSVQGTNASNEDGKKWGKIVKSPFGLRYTFGAPRS